MSRHSLGHPFKRGSNPKFGSAHGGSCTALIDGWVCGWPEKAHQEIDELGATIAYRIRAELVCCDIYEKTAWTDEAGRRHPICFWGEAAARIAEEVAGLEDDARKVLRDFQEAAVSGREPEEVQAERHAQEIAAASRRPSWWRRLLGRRRPPSYVDRPASHAVAHAEGRPCRCRQGKP
jgi:hypothetical protein